MSQNPVRRTYSERSRQSWLQRLGTDTKSRWAHAGGYLAMAGFFWGGLLGFLAGGLPGSVLGALGGILVLGVGVGGLITLVTGKTAELGGGALYNPSGRSTPRKPEYSRAQALAVQARWDEAVLAYHEHVARDPEVPDAYLALARVLIDGKRDYEEAARWLRRARRDARLSRGQDIFVARSLIELYWHRLGEPRRAAPELARLAEKYSDLPEGQRAADDLAEVKRQMAAEEG